MQAGSAVAVAVIFVWLGMVLAISFIEAPLKFRAPGVTLQTGLAIGRLVFRALNSTEAVLAVVAVIAAVLGHVRLGTIVAVLVAIAMLVVQLVTVRPSLGRRSDAVLAAPADVAGSSRRSHVHYVYVALEVVKVVALTVAGGVLLAS